LRDCAVRNNWNSVYVAPRQRSNLKLQLQRRPLSSCTDGVAFTLIPDLYSDRDREFAPTGARCEPMDQQHTDKLFDPELAVRTRPANRLR
jgi:hypothetical protein